MSGFEAQLRILELLDRGEERVEVEVRDDHALRLREEDDMHFAGAVDADCEALLDVGAPARPGDDRNRARKGSAQGGEELVQARQDAVLAQERHVHGRKERAGTGLLRRGGEDDAARCREPVRRLRDPGPRDRGRPPWWTAKPARLGVAANCRRVRIGILGRPRPPAPRLDPGRHPGERLPEPGESRRHPVAERRAPRDRPEREREALRPAARPPRRRGRGAGRGAARAGGS